MDFVILMKYSFDSSMIFVALSVLALYNELIEKIRILIIMLYLGYTTANNILHICKCH